MNTFGKSIRKQLAPLALGCLFAAAPALSHAAQCSVTVGQQPPSSSGNSNSCSVVTGGTVVLNGNTVGASGAARLSAGVATCRATVKGVSTTKTGRGRCLATRNGVIAQVR